MEKVEIKLTIEAERLDALQFFLSAKEHTTPQKELEKLLKELYEKYVPADTREYLDSKLKPSPPPRPRPKRPAKVETENNAGAEGDNYGQSRNNCLD